MAAPEKGSNLMLKNEMLEVFTFIQNGANIVPAENLMVENCSNAKKKVKQTINTLSHNHDNQFL